MNYALVIYEFATAMDSEKSCAHKFSLPVGFMAYFYQKKEKKKKRKVKLSL